MKPLALRAFSFFLLFGLFGACLPVLALDQYPFAVEILVDGRPLTEYNARGKTYIEALHGKEYSIRLINRSGGRVAVALAVDGLNSINAQKTTLQQAAKWLLEPYQTIVIDGWQTGSDTARKFFFTTERNSYGAWLGKTEDLGVISAAFFFEKRRPKPQPVDRPSWRDRSQKEAPAPQSAPMGYEGTGKSEAREKGSSAEAKSVSDDLAATGIGREVDHSVQFVEFEEEPFPRTILNLRYEYRDALVKLGVLPKPCDRDQQALQRREGARGFEGYPFAPDPYRSR